jgi:hypothetical protein
VSRPFVSAVAILVGLFLFVLGVWAFVAPHSFFEQLAMWQPYNKHFLHDVGAFQMGLGATLLLAIFVKDSLLLALTGVSVAAVLHAIAHAIDKAPGQGRPSDPYALGLLALVLVVAAVLRARAVAPRRRAA